jgi:NAD(P)-dependent dehydrogenase (short-subunit alcohol dehydrogenase family)
MMLDQLRLVGRMALITGAAGAIGNAVARGFAHAQGSSMQSRRD